MTKRQRFRKRIWDRLHNFTFVLLSAVFVAGLTLLGMVIVSALVELFFGADHWYARALEICSHLMALLIFVGSLTIDLIHQIEGTKLETSVNRLLRL